MCVGSALVVPLVIVLLRAMLALVLVHILVLSLFVVLLLCTASFLFPPFPFLPTRHQTDATECSPFVKTRGVSITAAIRQKPPK